MCVLRLEVEQMALSAAVDKDVARNLCIVHAILFHSLNLRVHLPNYYTARLDIVTRNLVILAIHLTISLLIEEPINGADDEFDREP